jgi:hypothetical protein
MFLLKKISDLTFKRVEIPTSGSMPPATAHNAPPVFLSGPVLGIIIFLMLCCTTTLYLFHDRHAKAWETDTVPSSKTALGYWPPPSGDFNWCEVGYICVTSSEQEE